MEREVDMRYKDPYMNLIMTPPIRDVSDYDRYTPSMSTMKIVAGDKDNSLGQVPQVSSGGSIFESMSPLMIGVSVFVISAFTAVTIYIIMSQMRRGR